MEEAQALYEETHPNVVFVDTQYKSSGELNDLLESGEMADIEISSSKFTMDAAQEKGLIDPDTRTVMFINDLVMVAGSDTKLAKQYGENQDFTLEMAASGSYTLCIGDDSVAAGNYANQSLSTVGAFNDPDGKTGKDSSGKANGADAYAGTPVAGKVIIDSSVSNVCMHAQSGDVDVAFVYASDVQRFDGLTIIGVVPGNTHRSIVYSGAVCVGSDNEEAAAAFLNWCLTTPEALEIWPKWGFVLAA